MTESYGHKRNKKRLMQYSFRTCQNCNDRGHFRSGMSGRKKLMGHMAVGLLVDIGQIELTQ